MIEGGAVATATGVGAGPGVVTMGSGLAMATEGTFMVKNAAQNMQNSQVKAKQKQEGSYTNTHESGKQYHGKGDEKRAAKSGANKAKENNDPLKHTDWTPAKNKREAFKQESRRLEKGGGHRSKNNYNNRDSPGTKYRKEDKD